MPEPALPARFGRYTLLERVGGGGMATVYRAALTGEGGFEKELALKMVRPELAIEPQFVEMFLDEARLSARLSHANLVQTFDFGQVDGTWFLAMEFVPGRTLAALLRICRTLGIRLGPARSAHIVGEVARGLGYAHRLCDETGRHLGLVHRDVSPQNVLISREGEVKLADFGIAKAASRSTVTRTGHVRGKCAYMAPEQARGEALDARTDVFALGVVFWECLTGRPLFDGASDGAVLLQVIQREIPPPSRFAPEVPAELDELALRMLARDRALRPADGDAVAQEIAALKLRLVRSPAELDLAAFQRTLSSGTAVMDAAGPGRNEPEEVASSAIVESIGGTQPNGWVDPAAETIVRRRVPAGFEVASEEGDGAGHVETAAAGSWARAKVRADRRGAGRGGSEVAGVAMPGEPREARRKANRDETAEPTLRRGLRQDGRAARRLGGIAAAAALAAVGVGAWMQASGPAPAAPPLAAEGRSDDGQAGGDAAALATTPGSAAVELPPGEGRGADPQDALAPAPALPAAMDTDDAASPTAPAPTRAVAGARKQSRAEAPAAIAAATRNPPAAAPTRPAVQDRTERKEATDGAHAVREVASVSAAPLPAEAPKGELVVTSRIEGRVAIQVDGRDVARIEPRRPHRLEVAAGERSLRFRAGATGMSCRVRLRVEPHARRALVIDRGGVFIASGTEEFPLRCLD